MQKHLLFLFIILSFCACNNKTTESNDRFPEGKTKKLITTTGIALMDSGLDFSLFAREPNFANPTNMDIDANGRVWLCEAYNYRNDINNIPYRKLGDRILILTDKNGDGKSDETKVYYQGEDVNSALGICVLGNKVIVSCSPNVLIFTDTNGDDKPDKKEILFKSISGLQSDHGLHSFVFGPDGKLYFNFGNYGTGLQDKNGQPIKDIHGRLIDNLRNPFQDGMAVRCDIDGTNFEVLGWNFRNNYELTVDSYGRIWQSDNDDDGNRGNRINYVMPNGNYGYKDEMTGADWRVERSNMEDSVFLRHWHQNDPGVIPNLAQTYAGSPTGIFLYEGDALTTKYHGALFLADAGTNEVNAYKINTIGAGYSLDKMPVLDAAGKDQWFRPSDICTAPDGTVFVADWYDAGVGGHFVGDLDRGRIYRVGLNQSDYKIPKYDYNSVNGLISALQNPNNSVRYLAYTGLIKKGNTAESALYDLFKNGKSIFKARALWLLAKINSKYIIEASTNSDENIRATAVRIVAENKGNNSDFYAKMSLDKSPVVQQTVASAIYLKPNPDAWLNLATHYKSGDKWMLEALGIGATSFWDQYLDLYLAKTNNDYLKNPQALDIIWRSRSKKTSDLLRQIIESMPFEESMRYFRAFDFQNNEEKNKALLNMLKTERTEDEILLIFKHFDQKTIASNPEFQKILPKVLANIKNEIDFVELVNKYEIKSEKPRLLKILYENNEPVLNEKVATTLAFLFGVSPLKEVFAKKPYDQDKIIKTIERMGVVNNDVITRELFVIMNNRNYPFKIREAAVLAMADYTSDVKLWNLLKLNKVSKDLIPAAKIVFSKTLHTDLKLQFEAKFGSATVAAIPKMKSGFLDKKGDAANGKIVFNTYCTTCHLVGKTGTDFGPALSQIGKKLTKESIYNAIINPSQGISFGYEGYNITLNDGTQMQGIITSKTADKYMVKFPGSSEVQAFNKTEVKKTTIMKNSMMPAFELKEKEYQDLVEYLSELK